MSLSTNIKRAAKAAGFSVLVRNEGATVAVYFRDGRPDDGPMLSRLSRWLRATFPAVAFDGGDIMPEAFCNYWLGNGENVLPFSRHA